MGETLVSQGLITHEDIQEAMFGKESKVISIGLPAYCLLQALFRSTKAGSPGILISKYNCVFFLFPLPFVSNVQDYLVLIISNESFYFCLLLQCS